MWILFVLCKRWCDVPGRAEIYYCEVGIYHPYETDIFVKKAYRGRGDAILAKFQKL